MRVKELYRRSPKLLIGTAIFSFFVFLATLGSLLYPVDPLKPQFDSLMSPSLEHPLGTDILGRDILAQLICGTRYSLKIGIMAALITTVIGVAIGGIGGYFGGIVDEILNLASNVVLTIPTIAFLIVIAAYFRERSEWVIILLISSTAWGAMARSIRSQVLSLKTRDFVDLAKLSGMGKLKILFFEVLPNMMAYLVMYFVLNIAIAIGSEAGLSAIGLGPTAIVSLGMLLRWAIVWEAVRYGAWWWFIPAGLSITLITLSLLLINDGLEQIYNPRARRG
ncbi:MAG: ABC transporter permease [Candidatus Bathyarchaeia archaeon]